MRCLNHPVVEDAFMHFRTGVPTAVAVLLTSSLLACSSEADDPPSTNPGGADAGVADTGGQPDAGSPDLGPIVVVECTESSECTDDPNEPFCNTATGECTAPPVAGAIGWGDGSPQSVDLTEIYRSTDADQATDLAFNPARPNELWVLHRSVPNELPCNSPPVASERIGCSDLEGSTTTIFDPGTENQRADYIQDFNAWHFMRRPPALAFGVNGFFATCGEARTGNFLDDMSADFMGPTLWTSDPNIYRNWGPGEAPADWNGTHMDMLHASPNCTGIAHEAENVYWVANGNIGSLDRYDFNEDHGPGQADHSDGEIFRYAVGTLTRVPFVGGHLVFHDGKVYAADAGGGRIISYDPTGARRVARLRPVYEPLADSATFADGIILEIVAPGGELQQPSGIEIQDGLIYVTDSATSKFLAYDFNGGLVRTLDTGLPEGSLSGFAFGPDDGKIYFVNVLNSSVHRIDPK